MSEVVSWGMLWQRLQRYRRFLIVGGLCALLNLAMLAILVDVWHWPWVPAVILAFVLLNFVGYRLNGAYTFRDDTPRWRQLLVYYGLMLVSLMMNLGLMHWLVDRLSLNYLVASALVSVLLSIVNYLMHAIVTFRPGSAR